MKRIFLITALAIILLSTKAYCKKMPVFNADVYPYNVPIPYYADSTTIEPIGFIYQSSGDDLAFNAEITEMSQNRFFVHLCELYSDFDYYGMNVWINKTNVIAWVLTRSGEDGTQEILLYDKPDGEFQRITYLDAESWLSIILDYALKGEDRWIKTMFSKNGEILEGWIKYFKRA